MKMAPDREPPSSEASWFSSLEDAASFLAADLYQSTLKVQFTIGRLVGFLRRMLLQKRPAYRAKRCVARRQADTLLARDSNRKALHRGGGWTVGSGATKARSKQWHPTARRAVLKLTDDALGNLTNGINGAHHLLLTNHDVVEQAFKLRSHTRIYQCWVSLLEHTKQF